MKRSPRLGRSGRPAGPDVSRPGLRLTLVLTGDGVLDPVGHDECDVEHPDDQTNVEHIVFREPDARV